MKAHIIAARSSARTRHLLITFILGASASSTWHWYQQYASQPMQNAITVNEAMLDERTQHAYTLYKQDNLDAAINQYHELLYPNARIATVHLHMGLALLKKKEYETAMHYARHALMLNPNLVQGYVLVGQVYAHQQKSSEALSWFKQAINKLPTYAEAHYRIANEYMKQKNYDLALPPAHKAYELEPSNVYYALKLGYLYNYTGNTQQALYYYDKARTLQPNLANVHYNIGNTLRNNNQPREAIAYLQKAIELQSHYPDAHVALSHCYWAIQDFPKAWQEYEWRWALLNKDHEVLRKTMWDGITPLHDKTILLFSEQGFGDTLQFIRYAQELKKCGAQKIICKIQGPLKTLLSQCPYIYQIITKQEVAPFDTQAALLSLPRILKTTQQTIPASIPYLYADQKLVELWKKRLAHDTNLKIGICWYVDQEHELTKFLAGHRSIPLATFAMLADVPGVSFYSLQKFGGEDQLDSIAKKFKVTSFNKDFDESHGRFMDTAALIQNLDLIISADTSIIHLAGGLGKPVWTVLPFGPDCRWGTHETTSAWYPTMQLFRATKVGDWHGVMHQIKQELIEVAKNFKKA